MGLVFLAWPALFLSLGWNFLAYGFFPPEGGWVWSWLFCGVLFVLMGAVPAHRGRSAWCARVGRRPGVRVGAGGRPTAADRAAAFERRRADVRRRSDDGPRRSRATATRSSTGSNASPRCAGGAT